MNDDADEYAEHEDQEPVNGATCPYCGEWCELQIDPSGGDVQEYVEDCPVCCSPWQVTVHYEHDRPVIQLEPAQ